MRTRIVTSAQVPTFDCDEIVHIERMGDTHLKFYITGPAPVQSHGNMRIGQHLKLATIWPIKKLAEAIRQAQIAAATVVLLTPEDSMGEPEGHG